MSIKHRLVPVAAATVAAAALLAGCAGTSPEEQAQGDGILDIAISFTPGSLDPAVSSRGQWAIPLTPVYEPLVRVGEKGELVPALAEEWAAEDGNTRFSFTIREGVEFSDGEAVTPQAVVDSINYWRSGSGPFVNNLATVDEITVDGQTVTITLTQPNPDFLWLFTPSSLVGSIISPAGLADPDALGTQPQGAGPYVLDLEETVTGSTYVYTPNENYYDQDAIEWEGVKITVYPDATAALQSMQTGQTDFMYSDASTANSSSGTLGDGINLTSMARGWTGLMIMDRGGVTDEALGDVRVRQALNYAVDRDALTNALFGEFGQPTDQVTGPGYIGYTAANDDAYTYDPEKARELLADAGYADGLTITNALFQTPRNSLLTESLVGQFAEVGVTLDVDTFAGNADWRQAIYTQQFGTAVEGNAYSTPYLANLNTFDKGAPFNGVFGLEDPTLTQLVQNASVLTGAEAEAAWIDVFTYVVDEAWFVPISTSESVYFYTGVVAEPTLTSAEVDILDLQPNK
jgi:peptide/nickel transport system substrate-binding protein